MVRPLLDVVDEGERLPLAIDFRVDAQREAVEPLVVAQVAEHRLDGGEAPVVPVATFMSTCLGMDSDKAVGKSRLRLRVAAGIVGVPDTAGVPLAAIVVRFLSLVASIRWGRNCGCPGCCPGCCGHCSHPATTNATGHPLAAASVRQIL